jgi:alcohol dehydrogenase class IV
LGATEAMLPTLARDALADVVSRNAPWLPDERELNEMLLTRL